jgi:hypothetical protein
MNIEINLDNSCEKIEMNFDDSCEKIEINLDNSCEKIEINLDDSCEKIEMNDTNNNTNDTKDTNEIKDTNENANKKKIDIFILILKNIINICIQLFTICIALYYPYYVGHQSVIVEQYLYEISQNLYGNRDFVYQNLYGNRDSIYQMFFVRPNGKCIAEDIIYTFRYKRDYILSFGISSVIIIYIIKVLFILNFFGNGQKCFLKIVVFSSFRFFVHFMYFMYFLRY